jgi:hypothetical protein
VALDESFDFDLAAAGLRADGADEMAAVEALARKLEGALPGRCRVGRRSVRLLSRDKRVEAIDVDLGDWTYALRSDGRNVVAERGQAVRGVTIKREPLALGDWIRSLAAHLNALAQTSAEARAALERLLTG